MEELAGMAAHESTIISAKHRMQNGSFGDQFTFLPDSTYERCSMTSTTTGVFGYPPGHMRVLIPICIVCGVIVITGAVLLGMLQSKKITFPLDPPKPEFPKTIRTRLDRNGTVIVTQDEE